MNVFLLACASFASVGLIILSIRSVDPSTKIEIPVKFGEVNNNSLVNSSSQNSFESENVLVQESSRGASSCATVEEMGKVFEGGSFAKESLRVRKLIQDHFALHGKCFNTTPSLISLFVMFAFDLDFTFL